MSDNLPRVIRYEGDNDTLVYIYKCQDLNTQSRLIVHSTQEAIFFKNGQALDSFGPGEHQLKTENLPFIKKFFAKLFGGVAPFPCEVYFINKVKYLDFTWGTDGPFSIKDPIYPVMVKVRSRGTSGVRIVDARKFIMNIAGQIEEFSTASLISKVKQLMLPFVKESIHRAIIEKHICVTEATSFLSEISEIVLRHLNNFIADLGISANHFTVGAIELPEGEEEKYDNVLLDDQERRRFEVLGEYYDKQRIYDIQESAAQNLGIAGTYMGLGLGFGLAPNMMGNMMNNFGGNMSKQAVSEQAPQSVCPSCGAKIPANSKFCLECGSKAQVEEQSSGEVVCSMCKGKNPSNAKFCLSCGAKLETKVQTQSFCPNCGSKLPAGSKFCPVCGYHLS